MPLSPRSGRTNASTSSTCSGGPRRSATSSMNACGSACRRCGCSWASSTRPAADARRRGGHDRRHGPLHLRRPRVECRLTTRVGYPSADAARLHQDARPRQRLHRLRRPPGLRPMPVRQTPCAGSAIAATASASTRRSCSSRHGVPARTSTTGSSTPMAPRSSNAATARAASRGSSPNAGAPRTTEPWSWTARVASSMRCCAPTDSCRSQWACRISIRPRCRSAAPARARSYRLETSRGPGRIRRRVDRQSARRDPRPQRRRSCRGHGRTRHGESRPVSRAA